MGRIHVVCMPNTYNLFFSHPILLKKNDQLRRWKWEEKRSSVYLSHELRWVFNVLLMLLIRPSKCTQVPKHCPFSVQSVLKGKLITHKRRSSPLAQEFLSFPPQTRQPEGTKRIFPKPDLFLPPGKMLCSEQPSLYWSLDLLTPLAEDWTRPAAVMGRRRHGGQKHLFSKEGRERELAGCFCGNWKQSC